MIENKYKKVKFVKPQTGIKYPLLNQLIFFHEIILAFGVHSGSFANLFWMMPKTIVIEFQFNNCYSAIYRLTRIVGLRLYSMLFPNFFKDKTSSADINLVMMAFELAIKELNRTFGVIYN